MAQGQISPQDQSRLRDHPDYRRLARNTLLIPVFLLVFPVLLGLMLVHSPPKPNALSAPIDAVAIGFMVLSLVVPLVVIVAGPDWVRKRLNEAGEKSEADDVAIAQGLGARIGRAQGEPGPPENKHMELYGSALGVLETPMIMGYVAVDFFHMALPVFFVAAAGMVVGMVFWLTRLRAVVLDHKLRQLHRSISTAQSSRGMGRTSD